MINLKLKIEQIIESEYQSHIDMMLEDDYIYKDAFVYYQNDILADFQEYIGRELNQNEIDKIYDYLFFWNPEENLTYHKTGFPYGNYEGEFSIVGNMGEIEIDLSYYFLEKPLKQSVIDAINGNTDLYVSDNNLAYYCIEYDVITLKNDNDTLMEALLSPLHEIGEFLPFNISWHIKKNAREHTL